MESYSDEVHQNLIAIFGEDFEELPGSSITPGSSGPSASSVPSASSRPSTSSTYQAAELVQIQRLADDEVNAEIDSDEEFLDANVDAFEESSSSDDSDQEGGEENTAQDPEGEDWTLHRRVPRPPVFTSQEEVRVDNTNAATPYDFFKLLFAPQLLLEQIV